MIQKFYFSKLDNRSRKLMGEEIIQANATNNIYYSTRFNDKGREIWIDLLSQAASSYDEHWLAFQLEYANTIKELEIRRCPREDYTIAYIPGAATATFAEGQFNRFYMAAICRRAVEDEVENVKVYRAKQRLQPRPESMILEGTFRNPTQLLFELRVKESSLNCILLKPNSGLSIDYEGIEVVQ